MIYIILVNYNGTLDTIDCVESIRRMNGPPISLIIIDNASKPNEVNELRLWCEQTLSMRAADSHRSASPPDIISGEIRGLDSIIKVSIVLSTANLGFAGGNNIGLKMALADATMNYVWVLNNDTEVHPDALTALVRRMDQDSSIGICGSTLVYFDNRTTVQALGGRFNKGLARPEQLATLINVADLPDRVIIEHELAYVVGASMLVSRTYLNDVGPMDPGYFLYFEEIDWAIRGRARFKLGWAPDSIVYHKEGRAIGTSSRSRPSDLSLHFMTRSTLRFLARHYPMLVPIGLGRLGLKALLYFMNGDREAALVICRSIVKATRSCAGARAYGPK